MITIINATTGEVLFATNNEIELQENEISIEEVCSENFIKAFFDFENRVFYEGATESEITEFNISKIPEKVQKVKFKLALIKSEVSTSIITEYIYSLPRTLEKDKIIVLWEDTDLFYRNDKTLNDFAPIFNISQAQLDGLFILADTL